MPAYKPEPLKILAGTQRKSRARESVALPLVTGGYASGEAEPPSWLKNEHAAAEWRRLVPLLQSVGLLTKAGLLPLAHLCAVHGAIVASYEAGEQPMAAMVSTLRGLSADFGLTPVAQTRVTHGEPEKKHNPFLEFLTAKPR